jgi:hypothetical protein
MIAAFLLDSHPNKVGIILYSNQNFHVWLSIINELFTLEAKNFPKSKPIWEKFSAALRGMNDKRVRLAHHTIHHGKTTGTEFPSLLPTRFDLRSKSAKYKPLEVEEILAFTNKVTDKIDELSALMTSMTEEHALLHKSPSAASDPRPQADAQ